MGNSEHNPSLRSCKSLADIYLKQKEIIPYPPVQRINNLRLSPVQTGSNTLPGVLTVFEILLNFRYYPGKTCCKRLPKLKFRIK